MLGPMILSCRLPCTLTALWAHYGGCGNLVPVSVVLVGFQQSMIVMYRPMQIMYEVNQQLSCILLICGMTEIFLVHPNGVSATSM